MKFYNAEEEARALEYKAMQIRQKAFDERPLPDFWRVGQLVRTLRYRDWAWDRGDIMVVSHVPHPNSPAKDASCFYVAPRGKNTMNMRFYCTPSDVELYRDWPLPKKDTSNEKV